jgi:hypothetical protein
MMIKAVPLGGLFHAGFHAGRVVTGAHRGGFRFCGSFERVP